MNRSTIDHFGPGTPEPRDGTRTAMKMLTRGLRRVRRVARSARHTPDRLLHQSRRERALALLRRTRPGRLLFVCLGNICRSPYAEHAFAARANGSVQAASAGFIGPNRPMPDTGQRVAELHGADLSGHRSRLFTAELVREADLVVVMDDRQRRALRRRFGTTLPVLVLGDLDPEPIDTRGIRDPYNQPEHVFEAVFARIDRCLDVLVDAIAVTDARAPAG